MCELSLAQAYKHQTNMVVETVRHNLLPPSFLLADQDRDMVVDQIISWLVKSLVL